MEFECQRDTKIVLKDTSTNCPDSPQARKLNSDQLVLNSFKKPESLENQNLETLNVKLGTHFTQPPPTHIRSLIDLPPALISEILKSLDPKELGIVSCVTTSLCRLASEHHVWKDFYNERWGHPVTSLNLGPSCLSDNSWKKLFVEREFRSKTFMGRYSIDTLYGHTEAVRAIFVLASKKLVFTSGYDQIVRMWDLEEGLSISSSRPLGCTIRAVAADSRVLIAGGTDGFIHGWHAEDRNPLLFDLGAPQVQVTEFRLWEHAGPITCLGLDFSRIYSGSWDMTVRVWDRSNLTCVKVLMHNDWVWSLVPHDTTIGSTAGSSVYIWETNTGTQLAAMNTVNVGNVFSLARSHTGKLLFTGGEDGSIHMFERATTRNNKLSFRKVAMWAPHSGSVYSLAFEFPWLVSASGDGKISLIDVRELLNAKKRFSAKNVEPPQRMLHGFGCNLFAVGIGFDRIVCGGEEGVVRIWNFSQALDIEERVRALRGKRIENRMRRGKDGKSGFDGQCSVAAKKSQIDGDENGWRGRRRVSGKVKA